MCGIISSSVPENPIGLDVREVPGVKKSAAEAKKISEDNCLSDRLKDVRLHFVLNTLLSFRATCSNKLLKSINLVWQF
jgi:hypothetical protein